MTQHLDSPGAVDGQAPPTRQLPRRGAAAPTRRPAVRWLSVLQLGRTAVEVVQATMFARFADRMSSYRGRPPATRTPRSASHADVVEPGGMPTPERGVA